MPDPSKPPPRKVAVSYSWGEEEKGESKGKVDEFCGALREHGVEVVRDVDRMKRGESIERFIKSIGNSDFLCVFLSDRYLKSEFCMHELLLAWRKYQSHLGEFGSRVKVWIMPGADEVSRVEQRVAHTKYWRGRKDALEAKLAEVPRTDSSTADHERLRRFDDFAREISAMLGQIVDILAPRSADEFTNWVREHFPATGTEPEARQLARVYENTVREMETLLSGNLKLEKLFAPPGFVELKGDRWVVSPGFLSRKIDTCRGLETVLAGLKRYSASRDDLTDIELIVGGIAVMTVNPDWVLSQRRLVATCSAHYPGLREVINLDPKRRAHFLHLVASALADGCARLHRVFGEPRIDEKQIPDPSLVGSGITEPDRAKSVMLHIVAFVIGPEAREELKDPNKWEVLIRRLRDNLRNARERRHDPFWGTGPEFARLESIIRNELKIEDLLLIHPDGTGYEDDVLEHHVDVLNCLHDIFQLIQSRRAHPAS